MRQRLLRLDRIAGQMNGWLLVIAIGLGMLDLAVLVVKCIPALTIPPPRHWLDRSRARGLVATPSRKCP